MSKKFRRFVRFELNGASAKAFAAGQRGDAARDAGQWQDAAKAYRDYLAERPQDGAVWVQLGHMLKETDRLVEAREAYENAVRIDPLSADAFLYYGHLLRKLGLFQEAADAYRTSFRIDGNADAKRELESEATSPEVELNPLADHADDLAPIPPDRGGGTIDHIAGAKITAWAVDMDASAAPARIGSHSTMAIAARQRGDAARDAGQWQDAAQAYRDYLAERPQDGAVWVQLGHMLKETDRLVEAREAYENAVRIDPLSADAFLYYGHLLRKLGLLQEAADAYRTSFRIDGNADAKRERESEAISREVNLNPLAGEELDNWSFDTTGFSPLIAHDKGNPVTSARFAIAKRLAGPESGETALFVTHSPDGVLKPHVLPYLEALRDNGVRILLVVVADRPVRLSRPQLDVVAGAMVRENVGYDFAAWAHALRLHPEVYRSEILYFINDSMFGPNSPDGFAHMLARLRASEADLIGLTENHESGWHIQSYFMAMKRPLLSCYAVQNFFGTMINLPGKQAVIDTYEVKLAPLVESNGFRTESLFSTNYPLNATMFGWRELIDAGFPFVKTLLFRQKSNLFDITNWERDLADRGFDVALLKDTLRHQGVTGRLEPGFPLLAMPADTSLPADAPLKVAFYGPWNYDNGLGSASRGIVAALRTTAVRLNLHPVKTAFHVHRPLAPAYDICDFDGPADVAVVHLNPDSWHLLTAEQRRDIALARKRIGYWVWEMAHLPPGWQAEFSSVDRIWAPSGYCADLFGAQNAAPVDVVPHAVPLPEAAPSADRAPLLRSLGVPAGQRVILYVFDGSSYLVRKNPHALVRAFAASGLGEDGWTLVLKTKHLMDRLEDGKAFAALAKANRHVVLIDRSLPEDELNGLFAAADIYASPHCSEGFGLTIAEAMAAGKSVVATDFSGSTEFLDASCGYPVRADLWRLTENFGHYTEGGEWARIDEGALAKALKQAAAAIARGDHRIEDAARERIRTRLSYSAVGERILASFAATFADTTPRWPVPAPLNMNVLAGRTLDEADLGDEIEIAPLQAGSLIPADRDELRRVPAEAGHWLLFAPADARINPHFRSIFMTYAASRPDVALFYADDAAAEEEGLARQLRLKPEFDVTLFVAQDYIGVPLLVRGSALHALGGLRHDLGPAALTDLILRAWTTGKSIARIPYVLAAHPGKRPAVPAAARRDVLAKHPALAAYDLLPGLTPDTLRLARRFDPATMPSVTLLVPTRQSRMADGTVYVARLLDSLAQTDWPMDRLQVLIADDVPGMPEWATKPRPFAVRRMETPRAPDVPFNYAAKMNLLWRAAETAHLVMLNDDVRANDPAWLKALMTFAMSEDVGAVGPLLLYEDGSVQHAGVVGGLFGVCAHAWLYRRSTAGTYQDWALAHREWSMITGAVTATRKAMMERVGGFDEQFALEFNDIDLCLRLRATGARIVYTPHARMTHAEKASRGATPPPPEDIALFMRRWRGWLRIDPAFHPKMNHHRLDLMPGYDAGDWFVH